MSFDSNKSTLEDISFVAKDMSFKAETLNGAFTEIIVSGVSAGARTFIHTNEESLREFNRVLTEVLNHVDQQRKVGSIEAGGQDE